MEINLMIIRIIFYCFADFTLLEVKSGVGGGGSASRTVGRLMSDRDRSHCVDEKRNEKNVVTVIDAKCYEQAAQYNNY